MVGLRMTEGATTVMARHASILSIVEPGGFAAQLSGLPGAANCCLSQENPNIEEAYRITAGSRIDVLLVDNDLDQLDGIDLVRTSRPPAHTRILLEDQGSE